MTSYEIMARAIVVQAVNDWCTANRTINKIKKPKSPKQKEKLELAKGRKSECESFFLGGWFSLITGIDGEAFVRDLKKTRFVS